MTDSVTKSVDCGDMKTRAQFNAYKVYLDLIQPSIRQYARPDGLSGRNARSQVT